MAERLVSPAVVTNEYDLSYLPSAINEIGATIIGPFYKGPAFIPTIISSRNEAIRKLGPVYEKWYTPYTVQEYLRHANKVTIVRVLWEEGYTSDTIQFKSDAGSIYAILAGTETGSITSSITSLAIAASCSWDEVKFDIDAGGYTASFNSADSNYIVNIFGNNPWGSKEIYVHTIFDNHISSSKATDVTASLGSADLDLSSQAYSNAATPYIISQKDAVNGSTTQLFKIKTLSDGTYTNTDIKVGIYDVRRAEDIAGSDYGTFGIIVRSYSDTDSKPEVLESFSSLTLDPDATNYVAKMVGDRYYTYTAVNGETKLRPNGNYENMSDYIRVEMEADVDSKALAPALVPFGFRAPIAVVPGDTDLPAMTYMTSSLENGSVNTRIYKGFSFDYSGSDDNKMWLKPTIDSATTASNGDFNLENTVSASISCSLTSSLSYKKFLVPLQGGFDGCNPTNRYLTNTSYLMGFDLSSGTTSGSVSYKKALDTISNPDEIDTNLIVMPGINLQEHSAIYTYAKNICEDRSDCFFIVDPGNVSQSVSNAISQTTTLDSNYAATYYPWIRIKDMNTNKKVWVPPSVVVPGAYAYNDKVKYEWFAPAGLNRGSLSSVLEARTRLTKGERDDLYDARINPIASFAGEGVVIWGQKNLQATPSALDRVNVRRLLIAMRKYIASISRYLVFEQNLTATRNKFLNTVNPYMADVQSNQGLYDFKVVMDETNNTAEEIDRNILKGEIWIQPARTIEYIVIDFNVSPTGATFSDI